MLVLFFIQQLISSKDVILSIQLILVYRTFQAIIVFQNPPLEMLVYMKLLTVVIPEPPKKCIGKVFGNLYPLKIACISEIVNCSYCLKKCFCKRNYFNVEISTKK